MTENKRELPFHIRLADVGICIEPMFAYMREYCNDYLTQEEAVFTVRTEETDILFEKTRSEREAKQEGEAGRCFSAAYLETLAVYRQIAEKMPQFDTLLFHGSLVAVDGEGYLFTAPSGTGKSTHTRLWRELFGSRAVMVNDDKPLLKITVQGVSAYGTPWNGKHRLSTNLSVPLKAVCILERGKENHIEEIGAKEVYPMLLQQTYRPMAQASMIQTLKLLDGLKEHIKFYRLGCNMQPEAARVAYEGMKGK